MTIEDDIGDIEEEFALLGDWEERFGHLLDLGRAMPPLPEADRSDGHRVRGCASQVWLVTERAGDTLVFRGDSDAHLVRGLVALVLRIFSGRTPAEILSIDPAALLARLGLDGALTPQRSNGLAAMMARIRRDAADALPPPG